MNRALLAAAVALSLFAHLADAAEIWRSPHVDPFNDPQFPLRRYDPLVTRNGNSVTIYPPLNGTTAIPDLNAPVLHVWPNDGTRSSSGSGPPLGLVFARSWSPEPESRDADNPRTPAPLPSVPTSDYADNE